MKRLIGFFTRQTLFGDLLSVLIILVGVFVAFMIRKEVFPNVAYDIISISTVFRGASPTEVEQLITNPLERDLKEVDGIKRLVSTSIESRSLIIATLDPAATDEERAKSDMREVVDRFVADLPDGAEKPVVRSIESKMQPIIEVSVGGDLPELEVRKVARDLEKELERVPGVAKVTPFGLRDLEVRVSADPAKLAAYRISLEDLVKSLRLQNLDISAGTIKVNRPTLDEREWTVRTLGQFDDLEDVRNTVIRANELGRGFRIRDVAEVEYDLAPATVINRTRGARALRLTVMKKENADAIDVVDAVKARVAELGPRLQGVKVEYVNDLSLFIRRRLSVLTGNLFLGLGLVMLVLTLLLPWRVSLVVALGEPFAFLGALILFYVMGHSINLVSLLGFIIVSGMLVDDAIVVVENSVRLMAEGLSPLEAAIEGTHQVWVAVTASVLTAVVAFLPMMFMSGIFGKFTREIPIGVILALLVSAYECYFILPGHIAHWISFKKLDPGGPKPGRLRRLITAPRDAWEVRLVPLYRRMLQQILRWRYVIAFGTIVIGVGTAFLGYYKVRFILFPPEDVEIFMIRGLSPMGSSLERTEHLMLPVEKAVAELPATELDGYMTMVGQHAQDLLQVARRGSDCGQVTVYLTPASLRERDASEIIETLRRRIGMPEGLTHLSFERVNPGPPVGKPVSVGVRGDRYEDIFPVVKHLKEVLKRVPGVSDVEDTYVPGKQELQVRIRPQIAAASGLSLTAIGNTVRTAYEGAIATTIRTLDEEIDVRVALNLAGRSSAKTLQSLSVPNGFGQLVPLTSVSRITQSQGPSAFDHEANLRQVKVTGEIDPDVTSSQMVKAQLSLLLPEIQKRFPDVSIDFGGESADTEESVDSLLRAFVVAFLGIFLILVATFRNLLQPVLVSLSIPLGVIAVVWVFFIHGRPLSFMAMLGVIALGGVIVNNSIVFIDFVNLERARGVDRWNSIINAGGMRLRPIVLTMLTTVLGLLPTAYGIGGEDNFVVPIALALGWGLFFGSALSTLVTPAALAITDDIRVSFTRRSRPSPS